MKTNISTKIFILFCFNLIGPNPIFSQTYNSYNDLAKEASDKKNYNLTIEYCNKSLALQNNGWAYWTKANAEFMLYKNKEAAEDYGNAIKYYTDNSSKSKLYFYRGDCYYNLFSYKNAIDDYSKANTYGFSDYGLLYKSRGDSYKWNGDYTKAIEDYNKALSYFASTPKKHSEIYQSKGYCNNLNKNYEDAINDYSKAIDIDPGNYTAYESRAYVYAKKLFYQKAKDDLTKAIELNTDTLFGKYDKGVMLKNRALYNYYLGNYEDGINDCEKANKTDSSTRTYWNLAMNLSGLKQFSKSNEAYIKERELNKDSTNKALLSRNISLNLIDLLNYKSALDEINKAILFNDKYAAGFLTRARIKKVQKNYLSAIDDYDKSLQLKIADISTIYKEKGEIYYILKDQDQALYNYKKYLELLPNNSTALYEYGRFLIESKKDIIDGKEKLKQCVALTLSNDTSSNYSFAKVFLGEKDEAINNLFRLIDKYKNDKDSYQWQLHVMACIYALSGNAKKAIEYQEKSFKAGYDDFEHLLTDRDFASIQYLPEYKALLKKYKMPIPKY